MGNGNRARERRYGENLCECGQLVALGKSVCHDCLCELNAPFMPTPAQIKKRAARERALREESGALHIQSSEVDDISPKIFKHPTVGN